VRAAISAMAMARSRDKIVVIELSSGAVAVEGRRTIGAGVGRAAVSGTRTTGVGVGEPPAGSATGDGVGVGEPPAGSATGDGVGVGAVILGGVGVGGVGVGGVGVGGVGVGGVGVGGVGVGGVGVGGVGVGGVGVGGVGVGGVGVGGVGVGFGDGVASGAHDVIGKPGQNVNSGGGLLPHHGSSGSSGSSGSVAPWHCAPLKVIFAPVSWTVAMPGMANRKYAAASATAPTAIILASIAKADLNSGTPRLYGFVPIARRTQS
jgi:hypothetical protein